ncbi:MAG: hypothetical protein NC324_03085 [Bacteroides sp.]|nr:hypothetical protein [Bacteroides sp.]
MIIQNGTIEAKRKTAGGIDPVTGFPVVSSDVAWGEAIPCQYSANKHNWLGRVNGERFTVAEYTILIEERPFEAEQIRLKDNLGNVVGEYSVMQIEPLEAVGEIKILV